MQSLTCVGFVEFVSYVELSSPQSPHAVYPASTICRHQYPASCTVSGCDNQNHTTFSSCLRDPKAAAPYNGSGKTGQNRLWDKLEPCRLVKGLARVKLVSTFRLRRVGNILVYNCVMGSPHRKPSLVLAHQWLQLQSHLFWPPTRFLQQPQLVSQWSCSVSVSDRSKVWGARFSFPPSEENFLPFPKSFPEVFKSLECVQGNCC